MIKILFKQIKDFTLRFLEKSIYINYIFFSFFLFIITFCSTYQTSFLFGFYSFLQAFALLIACVFTLNKIQSNFFKKLFVGISFFVLLAYIVNFILVGLINQSLFFGLNIFLSGGFGNLFVTLRAINLNFTMYLIIILAIIVLPLSGIFLYYITDKICLKKPLHLKKKHLFSLFSIALMTLFLIDVSLKFKNNDYFYKNQKRLPLGFTFISPTKKLINLNSTLKPIRDEKKLLAEINQKELSIDKKPNIFIFITEALRKDYITQDIAPNIFNFSEKNISFKTSYSAANATFISWYSIFHSNHPIYWSNAQHTLEFGSIPLNLLKKVGYKINVYSSAELQYFNLDKLIFGNNLELIDNLNDYSHTSSNPSIRDGMAIDTLLKDLNNKDNESSNVFIIFFDSTHSEYSWTNDYKPKFLPYAESINYLSLSHLRNDLDLIKNRYKNAIGFVDHLFNKFLTTLKNNNLYDDSLIVFTADHGEEFFEDGALFHGSHLSDYQLQIPIIYKLIKNDKTPTQVTTHIDIFPTIFSQIFPNENFDHFYDGTSIFNENRSPYIISANQRGNFTPNEFLITKNETKLFGKINSPNKNMRFEVDDYKNIGEENIESEITKAFEDLIQ
ncbi:MAG: hypothetical protein KR126chlam4_01181 [Candidatus Anoxychlamydiales bacterium]|nr:hypothetical protein [Candidatus Anoxychlamydiales bacterium]NGX41342.1 hypothetical protein [Candidatus Anoxychlamydiales bacterium]HEU64105.1 DUF229 domain-containing protein [Chlamydiota bacterium]